MNKVFIKTVLFGIVLLSFCSCKQKNDLEKALSFAGKNRSELEKVLAYYKSPEDSLKLKAAQFLICNMPHYYSYSGEALDSFRLAVKEFGMRHEYPVIDEHVRIVPHVSFEDKYGDPPYLNFRKVYDAHIITSGFLIENIELAFQTWAEKSWGKTVSFPEFCEEILPYRIGNEPLENWRKEYYNVFQPVLDSLKVTDPIDAGIALYNKIMNQRWIFDNHIISPHVGGFSLLQCRVGSCESLAYYATYIFRSTGIPSGIDCILQNPDMLYKQHFWNYMKDTSGRTIPFELYLTAPAYESNPINRKKGKVYRICFSEQPLSISNKYKHEKTPSLLDNKYIIDASSSYFEGSTVEISIDNLKRNVLYLGVFNNKTWIPIACSHIENDKAVFKYVESGIVYQPLFYRRGKFIPVSVPLITTKTGGFYCLTPDMKNLQQMKLYRKYTMPIWIEELKHRSIGGLFQGANNEDFSDAITLYTTNEELNMYNHRVFIDNPQKFKYLRYYSAPDSHCNMAEVQFISQGKELQGEIIGTDGSSDNSMAKSKYALFDNEPLTYFDSFLPDWAWSGLELEEPEVITEIKYQFRTDDNNIREGDVYELFYFSENGKVSLGKRTGDESNVLQYDNVPSNALYLLHNETRGREERVFIYENGQQIWW
ncbi:hypothetical protein AGMMS50262_13440 [Bacteroidia bacterium]|nr:hypothetical protein AGMMS50262_13440 [Bacteroidia bacterium]